MATERRIRFHVTGRVQGVGFRWATREAATQCDILGWVRNESDGSVVGQAKGDPAAVERFIEFLRCGPPASVVETCDVVECDPFDDDRRFRVLR